MSQFKAIFNFSQFNVVAVTLKFVYSRILSREIQLKIYNDFLYVLKCAYCCKARSYWQSKVNVWNNVISSVVSCYLYLWGYAFHEITGVSIYARISLMVSRSHSKKEPDLVANRLWKDCWLLFALNRLFLRSFCFLFLYNLRIDSEGFHNLAIVRALSFLTLRCLVGL